MDGQVVTTVIVQEDQWDVINRIKNQFYSEVNIMKKKSRKSIKNLTDKRIKTLYDRCQYLLKDAYKKRTDYYIGVATIMMAYYNSYFVDHKNYFPCSNITIHHVERMWDNIEKEMGNRFYKSIK